jgi:hypothetical protein
MPDSGPGLGWLLVGLGALFAILNQGAEFFARFRKPAPTETALANQPITIKADKEFASKSEHDGLRGEFKDFRDEVRVSFDEASQTSRQSREKIYVEQRRQAELLAHNTAKTDLTHQQIATMDTKIDRIRDLLAKLDRS